MKDHYCRAVIIVELPYPALYAPSVVLKQHFLDKQHNLTLSGTAWYNNQMYKPLNQSIGRIVRHQRDFGIVFLVDSAFPEKKRCLSPWLRRFVTNSNNVIESTKTFFASDGIPGHC